MSARSDRRYWALWWLIVIISLWLRTGFPIHGVGPSGYDDELFIRQARFLGNLQWLGPYGDQTLAKGMFYPLFILVAFLLAIPLNIAEQAVYLAVSACAGVLVLRVTASRRLALALFALLAFNPIVWNPEMSRVIREGLYISLSLGVVLLAVRLAFPGDASRFWRAGGWGTALGFVLGAFWLTREEGPWILPAVATTILISLLGIGRARSVAPSIRAWLRTVGLPLVAAGATFALSIAAVATMNEARYGVFITNEFKAAPFLRAYGAVSRIGQDHWWRFVVFPKDARARAYAVSPAARELGPVLDGPAGQAWARDGCVVKEAAACPEIPSDVFMWAFREAVATAGHYGSAPEAMRFYDRLARETNDACAAKRIPCGPARATMMPVFHWRYLGDALRDALPIGQLMLTSAGSHVATASSIGPAPGLAILADLAGSIDTAPQTGFVLSGWAASPSGAPGLAIRSRTGAPLDIRTTQAPGQDAADLAPGWSATSFTFRTNCQPGACDLIVTSPGHADAAIPLDDTLKQGSVLDNATLRVAFDYVAVRDARSRRPRGRPRSSRPVELLS